MPAFVWLVFSYAVLLPLLYWTAAHEPTRFTVTVFFVGFFMSWIPLYVFVNRDDIARNKVFWASQSAGLAAAAVVVFLIGPWIDDVSDAALDQAWDAHTWGGICGGFIAYYLVQYWMGMLIRRTFDVTESNVEKMMSSPGPEK